MRSDAPLIRARGFLIVGNFCQSAIKALGAEQRQSNPNESHKLLAELPLPVLITTNADDLLEEALREAGKAPESMLCPWNEEIERAQAVFDPDYVPAPERPLVFHLFGRWDKPYSLVLTEDDYFDFMIGVTSKHKLIPEVVRQMLSDSGLLFLGFQTEEWNFRVLYRSLLTQQGSSRRRHYAHIVAQIEPEDDRILELLGAKRYLEKYFGDADINIYWGSPGEFLGALLAQWRKVQFAKRVSFGRKKTEQNHHLTLFHPNNPFNQRGNQVERTLTSV